MIGPENFFDLADRALFDAFAGCEKVWDVLDKTHMASLMSELTQDRQRILGTVMKGATLGSGAIFLAKGSIIEPGAYVEGPAYIGEGATVRHGAYVRKNTIMFRGAVVGHASEVKHSILLPDAKAPHFAYIGDSVLGARVNLGAGTKLSNLTVHSRKDPCSNERPSIKITIGDAEFDTGLSKFGAILGDDVQIGCNVVLNPGCLVGPRTLIYANVSLRKGYYPEERIVKLRQAHDVTRLHLPE